MATAQDHQLIANKSLDYYANTGHEASYSTKERERFGFYFLGIDAVVGPLDLDVISNSIIDTDFCKKVLGIDNSDYGVDAITIDRENLVVNFYNFKYREDFRQDSSQAVKEFISSFELVEAISRGDVNKLSGRTRVLAEEISEAVDESWTYGLIMISNDVKVLDVQNVPTITDRAQNIELKLEFIGIDKLIEAISHKPTDIGADVAIGKNDYLDYKDNKNKRTSLIARVPAFTIIRMISNDAKLREKYTVKKPSELGRVELEYNALFDNVRGFLGSTKYNDGMLSTLANEPEKFFMFNNGITLTTRSLSIRTVSLGQRKRLSLEGIQVVNGGQTLRTLYRYKEEGLGADSNLKKAFISLRIFMTDGDAEETSRIAEYTNSQNSISASDLKSTTNLQIQIGQKMAENDILYRRKVGDTGEEGRTYSYEVTMERMAQILYSKLGRPDRASNYKKKLFDKYYSELFPTDIDINSLPDDVRLFNDIKSTYTEMGVEGYDQKFFYIVYLCTKRNDIRKNIILLEECLAEYKADEEGIRAARKLIQIGFLEAINSKIDAPL